MKQLIRNITRNFLVQLYQKSQPFFDVLIKAATLGKFSTNLLECVEYCLKHCGRYCQHMLYLYIYNRNMQL
jgi:hypothetical protein